MAKVKPKLVKSLEFEDCEACPFHHGLWLDEEVPEDGHGRWLPDTPLCVCTNGRVMRIGDTVHGGERPILCRNRESNRKKTFKGAFPEWCPLMLGVNHTKLGGWYGDVSHAPPEAWQRTPRGKVVAPHRGEQPEDVKVKQTFF